MQRVGLDIADHHIPGREHQCILVGSKLFCDITGNRQQRIYPGIVRLGHIQRETGGHGIHHIQDRVLVDGYLPLFHESRRIGLIECIREGIHGLPDGIFISLAAFLR